MNEWTDEKLEIGMRSQMSFEMDSWLHVWLSGKILKKKIL